MLQKTPERNPYVHLDAMKHSGCAVNRGRHVSCENCGGNVSEGFNDSTSKMVLFQNNIRSQFTRVESSPTISFMCSIIVGLMYNGLPMSDIWNAQRDHEL